MNFFEAYVEAKNGKKIAIDGVSTWWAQLDDDKESNCTTLNTYSAHGKCSDIIDNSMIAHWLGCEWQIYEEPKESKGLWEKPIYETNGHWLIRITSAATHPFSSEKQYVHWGAALNTFMRLKGHPLAIPFDNSKLREHYCIFHNPNGLNHRDIGVHLAAAGHGTQNISPSFSNFDDANQALKDLGADDLLHMFKTFQGIYE